MKIPDIKAMFVELNDEHFDGKIPDIPVVWNRRMTTTAGYCRYRRFTPSHPEGSWAARGRIEPYKIDLSYQLFEKLEFDIDKVKRTLIHEMVHAFLVHIYNERGHGWRFQQMMTDNHRCHNYDTNGLRRKQTKRVQWTCTDCGKGGWRVRMPKAHRRNGYTCRACGGKVEFVDMSASPLVGSTPSKVKIF